MTINLQNRSNDVEEVPLVPLIVDLDGTLSHGDTLWESLAALLRENFLGFIQACFMVLKGRAAFKKFVADQYTPKFDDLSLNQNVLEFAREESTRRPVVLATAADKRIADIVARELSFFTRVIASENGENFKGDKKREAIEALIAREFDTNRFEYIGDSKVDRPIWEAAGQAHVVASSEKEAKLIAGECDVQRVFEKRPAKFGDYVKAIRPHQWAKNLLIFLPLFLSHQYLDSDKAFLALSAFISFSLCASASYIWNDILDIKADRLHPTKCERPFASGALSILRGIIISFVLLGLGALVAVMYLPGLAQALIAGYLIITLSYSLYLKEKFLIDAMTLALLYGYRIVIGGVAAAILVSDWLIVFSVFFFFGLALVKRYTEIASKEPGTDDKIAGRGYASTDREIVSTIGVVSSLISVLIMGLYISSSAVVDLYSTPQILWVVTLVMIYWVSRIWMLAHRGLIHSDPVVFALKDGVSIFCTLICAGAVLASI